MKTKEAKKHFNGITKLMDQDTDPYMMVHFSKDDDYYYGQYSKHLDMFDAIIIIKKLIDTYKINKKCL